MIRNRDRILKQIEIGEDTTIEFKDLRYKGDRITGPHRNSIADELAAMANTHDGVIVFGVDDKNKTINGIPNDKIDIVESWLNKICHDLIKPQLQCFIHVEPVRINSGEEKIIIIVGVPQSVFAHQSPSGYYQRFGSTKRKLTQDSLARLFQQRSQVRNHFDEQSVPNASLNALDLGLLMKFKTEYSPKDDFELLTKLNLLTKNEDGKVTPSVSGILMLSKNPHEFLPSAFIQAVCYRGKERNANYQIDAKDIHGPLDVQIEDAFKFVKKNMRYYATKHPGREDIPQYSTEAVFEAIVNAVAHRDYSVNGSKIRLHIFEDRLEIFSPGSLHNKLTIDAIAYRQTIRNQLLTSLLASCPLPEINLQTIRHRCIMDIRGEGVPIILSESEKLSGKCPAYRYFNESEIMLTIFATEPPQNNVRSEYDLL